MQPTVEQAVRRCQRRLIAALFVTGLLQAATWLLLGWIAVLLLLRLDGRSLPVATLAYGLPVVLLHAGLRARQGRRQAGVLAAHLDRRLGAQGLLLAAADGVALAAAQRTGLAAAMQRLPAVLPRLRWRQQLVTPFLVASLLALLLALPAPVPTSSATPALARLQELQRLAAATELLAAMMPKDSELADGLAERLQRQLADMQQRAAAGAVPEWRELDQLERQLQREQQLAVARELAAKNAEQVSSIAAGLTGKQLQALAQAAERLAAAGLLDALPEELRTALHEAGRADGRLDPAALALDPAELQRLAAALQQALQQPAPVAGEPQAGLAAGELGAGDLADLAQLLGEFGGAGGAGAPAFGGDTEGEAARGAAGGVGRGPGHAALLMTGNSEGAADQVLPLPKGREVPGEWVPLGSSAGTPDAPPVRNTAAGGAAAAGTGDASWQLDLPPRQREILRRFYNQDRGQQPR